MDAARGFAHGTITLVRGDLVEQEVDAIVNAANTKLLGGGGVDGAIHRAAGPALRAACEALPADNDDRRCPTGDVRVTDAGALPARIVIHAVGPFFNARSAEKNDAQLRAVHALALAAAAAHGCRSIAFPAISTGAYRFPLERAAAIALATAADFLALPSTVADVRFVLYSVAALDGFRAQLSALPTAPT